MSASAARSSSQRQQPLGRTQVADRDERLDRDRACKLGSDLVHLPDAVEQRCDLTPGGMRIVAGELERGEGAVEAMSCASVTEAIGGTQELSSCRGLGLASVGVDLCQDHPAERLNDLSTRLPGDLHRFVAELRRDFPLAGSHFHPSKEELEKGEIGIVSFDTLCDQLSPDRSGLVVAFCSAELMGQGPSRIAAESTIDSAVDLDCAVENVAADAPGAPERYLRELGQGEDEGLRLGKLLGQLESRCCVLSGTAAVAAD